MDGDTNNNSKGMNLDAAQDVAGKKSYTSTCLFTSSQKLKLAATSCTYACTMKGRHYVTGPIEETMSQEQ